MCSQRDVKMPHSVIDRYRWSSAWPVLLLAIVGVFGYLLKITHWFTMVPGDLGDARFNSVILEHFYQWLQGKSASLWSPEFFYPYPNTLAFSDNHFGTAWIYVIARLCGLSRETGFDVWYFIGFLLSYFCCAYAARKFGFSWFAAATAAFVFAFSPAILAQDIHAQLVYRYAIPLAIFELWQIQELRRLDRLPWLSIWLALQFFCSIYLGFFLAMLLGAITVASIYTPKFFRQPPLPTPRQHRWLQTGAIAVAVILWAGLMLMLAKYHFVAKQYQFGRNAWEIRSMLPRIGSYFLADRSGVDAWVGNWVTNVPMRHEQQMFFGLFASILTVMGAISGRHSEQWSRHSRIFTLALLILIALTLSVGGFSLYRLVLKIPGFNSMRAVSRISLVMLLPVAWLSAIGTESLIKRFSNWRPQIFLTIAALLAIELLSFKSMHVPITQWRDRLSSLASGSKVLPNTPPPILYTFETAPEQSLHIYREIDGMVLAQDLGVPTVNGYSGNLPADFGSADSCIIAARRLTNAAAFEQLSPSELAGMLGRLTVLPTKSDCPDFSSLKPYAGALANNVFGNVSIALVNQKTDGPNYVVTVEVTNHSQSYLPALSTTDQSLQFSWQFVLEGQSPTSNGWNTRAPLDADVPSGTTYRQDIRVQPPTTAGRYVLAFSLVQDKVAWFHDKGMSIAISNRPIDVASSH